ncbi:hypothetical protein C5615_29735 [Burkholderia cepacia]|uniref:Uncharacterized protein n=1 Tax=Burkholderia cepacia TaxID=292 RepID=A0A2S8IE88_BURCE|nr:hypothetical protein [Burkholderia cepacia]PQP13097.1 hypothetical protein C5615_29735 [Burkholderia cepacia]HDR9510451.1 hypothetical protein [Burkholderia cepacia]
MADQLRNEGIKPAHPATIRNKRYAMMDGTVDIGVTTGMHFDGIDGRPAALDLTQRICRPAVYC